MLISLAVFVSAVLSVTFARFDGGVAFIWGASGLLLAYLLAIPYREWLRTITLSGLALMIEIAMFGLGWRAVAGLLPALLFEPVLAAFLLRRFGRMGVDTQSLSGMAWLIGAAAIVAPALSGVLGAMAVSQVTAVPFGNNFIHWFAAHALGAVVATPIASGVIAGNWRVRVSKIDRSRAVQSAFLIVIVVVIGSVVFSQSSLPLLFVPLLPMIYATMRGGRVAAFTSIIVLAVMGGFWTAQGYGPIQLIVASSGAKALFLQGYVATAALIVLPVAALLTEQTRLTQRWQRSEARYRAIADSLGDAVLDISDDGLIRYASPAIVPLFGKTAGSLTGTLARELIMSDDRADVAAVYHQAALDPKRTYLVQFKSPNTDGLTSKWLEASVRAVVMDGEFDGLVASIRDISDRKAREIELERDASSDPLTGIANRRSFVAQLQQRCLESTAGEGEGSLVVFDLDHFKSVNDEHGHGVGDLVLKAVASTAAGLVRPYDCVARIGGEEFAIIFWHLRPELAAVAAERLRRAIAALVLDNGKGGLLRITASVGLAAITPSCASMDVLHQADLAMYEAKRSGRNRLRIVV